MFFAKFEAVRQWRQFSFHFVATIICFGRFALPASLDDHLCSDIKLAILSP
jgi:hypothetical protein